MRTTRMDGKEQMANIIIVHRGKHLSYQRGKRNTNPNTSLIAIGTDTPFNEDIKV